MSQKLVLNFHWSDNPWRRGRLTEEITPECEKIIMEARCLLNKLSEQNFNVIYQQFSQLTFSQTNQQTILNILFLKASLETKFTELYAQLFAKWTENVRCGKEIRDAIIKKCVNQIKNMHKPFDPDIFNEKKNSEEEPTSFNSIDRSLNNKIKVCNYLKEGTKVCEEKNVDTSERFRKDQKQMKDLSDYNLLLKKKLLLGACQFLGELFKENVVELELIFNICFELLRSVSETHLNIECVIKLLSVSGNSIENMIRNDLNKIIIWNDVIEQIENLVVMPEIRVLLPKRIYFMILDFLDLKDRDWLPRVVVIPLRRFKVL